MSFREYTIFYSWQSDADRKYNWDFIQGALGQAAKQITERHGFDIPIIDWGLERIGGTPEVSTIMFQKIRAAAIFVGDLSLVGEIKQSNAPAKKTANPNVLMEMAYAGAKLGWNRVVCVMNTKFGKAEKLPVDIRNRRFPIRYKLSAQNEAELADVKKGLVDDLIKAIDAILYQDNQAVISAERRFDLNCIRVVDYFRDRDYFHLGLLNQAPPEDEVQMTLAINAAIPRLLDLGLIVCDWDVRQQLYAYHWTFLGRLYIRQKWPNDHPAWIREIDAKALPGPNEVDKEFE